MKKLLERYGILRSPEGEGGSGAAAAGAGAGAGAAAAAGSGGDAGEGAGAGGPGAGGAASPGGAGAGSGAAPATPYYPEGMPEAIRGKSDRETIDKQNAALKGYREQDATRDVPADEKGYLSTEGLQGFKVDDAQKPYFEALEKDPAFAPIAKVAKEHKVGRRAFLDMWQAGMKAMGDAGLLEPAIDVKAERDALVPESAKALSPDGQSKAIDKRMQENFDFLDLIAENRGPADPAAKAQLKKDVEYAQLMLGDSAKGHRFIEFLKNTFNAGGSGPTGAGGGGGGGDTKQSLEAELAKPEMQAGHPSFDKAKWDDLQARFKKVHGA